MAEQVVYAKLNISCSDPRRRAKTETPKPAGHHCWISPYTSGLLILICIILLGVSAWLAATRNSENHMRLKTEQNLTRMLEDANQRVQCLRTAILVEDQSAKCPPGWTMMSKKCYFLSTDNKTREDSERFCVENGAVLARVRSQDSVLKCHMHSRNNTEFWVGLQRKNTWIGDVAETKWLWSDNTLELSMQNTISIECVKMGQSLMFSPCDDLLPWICEKNPDKSNLLKKADAC